MKKILRKFLNDNAELYPKYCPDNTPCDCKCNSDNELYWNFYFGNGSFNKYDWERHLLGCMFKKRSQIHMHSHIQHQEDQLILDNKTL